MLRLLPPDGAPPTVRRRRQPERPLHDQRRPRLLRHHRLARPAGHQRARRRLRVRRRPAAADHDRHRRADVAASRIPARRPGRRQRRRQSTSTSRTYETLVPQDHNGALPQVLRRPHQRRLRVRTRRSPPVRGRRRVPRRRQLGHRRRREIGTGGRLGRGGNLRHEEARPRRRSTGEEGQARRSACHRKRAQQEIDDEAATSRPLALAVAARRRARAVVLLWSARRLRGRGEIADPRLHEPRRRPPRPAATRTSITTFELGSRLTQRTRRRCDCKDPKDLTHPLAGRRHRQPARRLRSARWRSSPCSNCPADSQVGVVRAANSSASGCSRSTASDPQTGPGRPASASRSRSASRYRSTSRSRPAPTATTAST